MERSREERERGERERAAKPTSKLTRKKGARTYKHTSYDLWYKHTRYEQTRYVVPCGTGILAMTLSSFFT